MMLEVTAGGSGVFVELIWKPVMKAEPRVTDLAANSFLPSELKLP
jgi:hypothetical protein